MTRQKKLTFFTASYAQAAVVFPFIMVSPAYFAGARSTRRTDADGQRLRPRAGRALGLRRRSTAIWPNGARWSSGWTASTGRWPPRAQLAVTPPVIAVAAGDGSRRLVQGPGGAAAQRRAAGQCRRHLDREPASGCWSAARPAPASRRCSARSPASGRSAPARSRCRKSARLMILPQRPYFPIAPLGRRGRLSGRARHLRHAPKSPN